MILRNSCNLRLDLYLAIRDHAKLLWKRIPGDIKVSHPEIGKLWEIGTKLWIHSFSEVYSLIKDTTWPPHIVPILAMLNGMIVMCTSILKVDIIHVLSLSPNI